MTEDQATQQLALLASMYNNSVDGVTVTHQILGTTLFLSHVLAGLLFLVLMFGLIISSQLRKSA